MKMPLEKYETDLPGMHLTQSQPFVDNIRGRLVHRPKSVMIYRAKWGATWFLGQYWCGGHLNGGNNLTFLDEPPENRLVCARCETKAVEKGFPSAELIVGHHIHLGRVTSVRTCCDEVKND